MAGQLPPCVFVFLPGFHHQEDRERDETHRKQDDDDKQDRQECRVLERYLHRARLLSSRGYAFPPSRNWIMAHLRSTDSTGPECIASRRRQPTHIHPVEERRVGDSMPDPVPEGPDSQESTSRFAWQSPRWAGHS